MTKEDRKSQSDHYRELFTQARRIMNEHDLICIMVSEDAPEDEYDMETARILPLLYKRLTFEVLCSEIAKILNASFGVELPATHKSITSLATDLLKVSKHVKS